MTMPRGKENKPPLQPYRVAGVVVFLIAALVLWLVFLQYRGDFTPKTQLTMLSSRAGLVMDPGSKVTYNGVQIGRVATISEVQHDGRPAAKFTLDIVSEIPQADSGQCGRQNCRDHTVRR